MLKNCGPLQRQRARDVGVTPCASSSVDVMLACGRRTALRTAAAAPCLNAPFNFGHATRACGLPGMNLAATTPWASRAQAPPASPFPTAPIRQPQMHRLCLAQASLGHTLLTQLPRSSTSLPCDPAASTLGPRPWGVICSCSAAMSPSQILCRTHVVRPSLHPLSRSCATRAVAASSPAPAAAAPSPFPTSAVTNRSKGGETSATTQTGERPDGTSVSDSGLQSRNGGVAADGCSSSSNSSVGVGASAHSGMGTHSRPEQLGGPPLQHLTDEGRNDRSRLHGQQYAVPAQGLGNSSSSSSSSSTQPAGEAEAWRPRRPVAPGRVQIWWTALDPATTCSDPRVSRYTSCLSAAEAAEVAASKAPDVAAKRTAARALARCALARAVTGGAGSSSNSDGDGNGVSSAGGGGGGGGAGGMGWQVLPQDLTFERNSHGKPSLVARPGWAPLQHNLTHTHDLAGVALYNPPQTDLSCTPHGLLLPGSASSGSEPVSVSGAVGAGAGAGAPPLVQPRLRFSVGLDVERLDRAPKDPLALARRRLAPSEVRDLEALSGEARARHFMWLWTLKEAYVKARGTGINAPPGLKGFAIGFQDMHPSLAHSLSAGGRGSGGGGGGADSNGNGSTAAYRISQHVKRITLEHTSSCGALSSTGGGAVSAVSAAAPASSASRGGPQEDSPPFNPATTSFAFLLFQPTARHVGALCLAVEEVPEHHYLHHTPDSSRHRHRHLHDTAVAGVGTPRHAAWGSPFVEPSPAIADVADAVWGGGQRLGGKKDVGAGPALPDLLLADLVEQWWCTPLEDERRLGPEELVLLGVS